MKATRVLAIVLSVAVLGILVLSVLTETYRCGVMSPYHCPVAQAARDAGILTRITAGGRTMTRIEVTRTDCDTD